MVDEDVADTKQLDPALLDRIPSQVLRRGDAVGRYIVLDPIGEGGMGIVYRAYDPELDRSIALKLVWARGDAQLQKRVLGEAQALARLAHPNVVAVHDVGTFEGWVFLAMELVEGKTMRAWLREKPRTQTEALPVLVAAGDGLAAAHRAGLVHRDFKPENVLVGDDGRIRVADFGLARAPGADDEGPIAGTPRYMAPEQKVKGGAIDARADQYAFSVALKEALGDNPPRWVRPILARGLAERPGDRFPSMDELLAELRRDPAAARRRWMVAGGIAVALIAGGVGWRQSQRAQARMCASGAERLAGVWDAARRQSVHDVFARTNRSYAEAAFREVAQVLDEYANKWQAMHRDACEATRIRGEQSEELLDLRMQCLGRRLEDLRAQVDVLVSEGVVDKAAQAVRQLPPLADCANAVSLRAPVRADPAARPKIDAIGKTIARARALRAAGKYPPGLAAARAAVKDAAALSYRPLEAEAELSLGALEDAAGDYKAAEKTLREAARAAEAGRSDAGVASAWTMLVWVVGSRQGRIEEGHAWARDAEAMLERLDGEAALQAQLLKHESALYEDEGKFDEARARAEKALAIVEKLDGPKDPQVALHLTDLGDIAQQQARTDEALADYRRALAITEAASGPDHPANATIRINLGMVLRAKGDYAGATTEFKRALAILEAAVGREHPNVATVYLDLGSTARAQGDDDQAVLYYDSARAIWEKTLGADHANLGTVQFFLGQIAEKKGHHDEALEHMQRALAIWQKALGPEHPSLGAAYEGIGEVQMAQGRLDAALASHQKALSVMEKALGPKHPELAAALIGIGEVELRRGHAAAARASLERAVAILEANPGDGLQLAQARKLYEKTRAPGAGRRD